jgi:phosphoribosylformylglycinamidine (FGAM) synthase PurS component
MSGANLLGIYKVYGNSSQIKSCEFHFKDNSNKKAQKLDVVSADEFKNICDNLLCSTTIQGYDATKKEMDKFINSREDSKEDCARGAVHRSMSF